MDKAAVLTHILATDEASTLLGGEPPARVIPLETFTHPVTAGPQGTEGVLHHVIQSTLSAESRRIVLTGPEGSGKTTALEKLVLDWARGEQLQQFSHVFCFRFRDINRTEGLMSLESLIHLHHLHPCSAEGVSLALQEPEAVLVVFDGLEEYNHSVDPSVHSLCSHPSQPGTGPRLVASVLHGSLLKGATVVVSTRPTEAVGHVRGGVEFKVLGFPKPQRAAYFHSYFTDPEVAGKALAHMERTLGSYDFSASPRFCWTVCSVYKAALDRGEQLPETLTQLFVQILVNVLNLLSLSQTANMNLVLDLGKMASECRLRQSLSCNKKRMSSLGLQQVLSSATAFLRVDGELDSDSCVLSFHCQQSRDFVLALSFFLDKSNLDGVEEFLQRYKDGRKIVDLFLSGLSEPVQRKPLELLLGEFSLDQIKKFKSWFQCSSEVSLKGYHKEEHYQCFRLLHQSQNESLVKDIISSSSRIGIGYGGLGLQDCVALSYVVTCLGEMETLNLYSAAVTEEISEALRPALRLSHRIKLSQSSLDNGAVQHLASAIKEGFTSELELEYSRLGDEKSKILFSGFSPNCKLHRLNLQSCGLTKACCEELASALTSLSQLRVLNMTFNEIEDQGFTALCKALQSPHCNLKELEVQRCNLTSVSMEVLSAALCSGGSKLERVNLTQNQVCNRGVEALSKALQSPHSKLQSLNLFDSELTGACCPYLKEALMSEHCSLSDLDLSVNTLGPEGALLLCQALRRPGCPIERLCLTRCGLTVPVFEELGSVLRKGDRPLKTLAVGLNKVGDEGVKHLWDALAHPSCQLEELDVEMTDLTDACVEDLCAALRASRTLKSLELRNNTLTDASVPALVQVMQDSLSMQEMNLKYNDFSEEVFEMLEECDKIRY